MRFITTLARMARDFAVFYRLRELSLRMLGVQAQASTGVQPRDAAVSITCAAAVLFLVLGYLNEAPPMPIQALSCETSDIPARAKGARQQGREQESFQGPHQRQDVGQHCGPWV